MQQIQIFKTIYYLNYHMKIRDNRYLIMIENRDGKLSCENRRQKEACLEDSENG